MIAKVCNFCLITLNLLILLILLFLGKEVLWYTFFVLITHIIIFLHVFYFKSSLSKKFCMLLVGACIVLECFYISFLHNDVENIKDNKESFNHNLTIGLKFITLVVIAIAIMMEMTIFFLLAFTDFQPKKKQD